MLSPIEPFKPPTSPPPPINWATKPKQATATLTTDGRRLAIFIDLEQAGLRLANCDPNRSSLPAQELKVNLDQLEEESVFQEGSNGNQSHLSRSFEDLSSTLSRLSVTDTPSQSPRSPSKLTPTASPTKKRKRYYVVTVGRCAGVFCDDWYIFICLRFYSSTHKYDSYRDNVKPLIEFISGARYKSYPTRADAVAAYQYSKANNLVRIVRDPGDDDKYGPMFYAMQ
jgi:hypothetical protein